MAKALALAVAAYAFSPVDLIPDFIPVLGMLDDLVIVPLGVWIALRLMPPDLIAELRARAATLSERPISRGGLVLVIASWLAIAAAIYLTVT